jgi:hypothetical protein
MLGRVHNGLRTFAALRLSKDSVDVRLHPRLAEVERRGGFVVRQAECDVREDFCLSNGQPVGKRAVTRPGCLLLGEPDEASARQGRRKAWPRPAASNARRMSLWQRLW